MSPKPSLPNETTENSSGSHSLCLSDIMLKLIRPRKLSPKHLILLAVFGFVALSLTFQFSDPESAQKKAHLAIKQQQLTQDLNKWSTLFNNTPIVHVGTKKEDLWFAEQASLYRHMREMIALKEDIAITHSLTSDVQERLTKDMKIVESVAIPFVKQVDGLTAMERLQSMFANQPKGRGLVIAGGNHQFRFLLHILSTLRNVTKCTLPIEIWYRGRSDLSEEQGLALEGLGPDIVTRDLFENDLWNEAEAGLKGATYALKPFALLASSFAEPILCDADVAFIEDPEKLYDIQGYQETGTLYFHDRIIGGMDFRTFFKNQSQGYEISAQLNSSRWYHGEGGQEQESGVVLIDKRRKEVLLSMVYVTWMNSEAPRKILSEVMFGDKETFWMGFELTRQPYYFLPSYGGPIGMVDKTDDGRNRMICDQVLHFAEDSRPLWFNGGLLESKHMNNPGWMKADGYVLDDGSWSYGVPKWTYFDGTMIKSALVESTINEMTSLISSLEQKSPYKEYAKNN